MSTTLSSTKGNTGEVPRVPPPPKLSELEEDIRSVLALDIPKVDKSRKFPGLEKQKIAKKDRHVVEVDAFSNLLEEVSEKLEKEVLEKSREIREKLEVIDNDFQVSYRQLEDDEFLTVRSEQQLITILGELKDAVSHRSQAIEQFANDLNGIETKRADIVGSELKKYTDKLIGIAHQLPDDIEHIVETETFELNSVLTKNKQAYAQLVGLMNKRNVEVEVETLQRWEDARKHWRTLRHNKGIRMFLEDIHSDRYADPKNRQDFMRSVRDNQAQLHSQRQALLEELSRMMADNISSEEVTKVQHQFSSIHEAGLEAIQACYNGLGELRVSLQDMAKNRVEELRKELHKYGALKDEPKLRDMADVFQSALENPALLELWRLGGGLKTEFQTCMHDMRSENIVYDDHMRSIQTRVEVIVSGFDIKAVLEERGRLVQLEKIRSLLIKMRNVSREDVPDVLHNLMPELEENLEVGEKIPAMFHKEVSECLEDMRAELARVAEYEAQMGGTSVAGGGGDLSMSRPSNRTSSSTTGKKSGTKGGSTMDKTKGGGVTVDPISVRHWNRRLGILYYGSDLSEEYQQACNDALAGIIQQRGCNELIDQVIKETCDKPLLQIEKSYKKLMDNIATYLENQANYLFVYQTNLGNFYLLVAKMMERHRKLQHELDERSMDELFDKKEDFRLEREDREAEFEEACMTLRKSTDHVELQANFEAVLNILSVIQDSYRQYHEKACFIADKHPLSLIDEFRSHLLAISKRFEMTPIKPHFLLDTYDRLFDKIQRFNKNIIEAEPDLLTQLPPASIEFPQMAKPKEKAPSKSKPGRRKSKSGKGAMDASAEYAGEYVSPVEENYLAAVRAAEEQVMGGGDGSASGTTPPGAGAAGRGSTVASVGAPAKGGSATAQKGGKANSISTAVAGAVMAVSGGNPSGGTSMATNASIASMTTAAVQNITLPRGGKYGLLRTEDVANEHLTLESTMQELEEECLREEAAATASASGMGSPSPNASAGNGAASALSSPMPTSAEDAAATEGAVAAAGDEGSADGGDGGSMGAGEGQEDEDEVVGVPVIEQAPIITHEDIPWINASTVVKTPEEIAATLEDPDDRFLYDQTIAKGFVELTAEQLEEMEEEKVAEYHATKAAVAATNQRVAQEADPAYIRAHVPQDLHGNNWVLVVEISTEQVKSIVRKLKDSLVSSLETEVQRRIAIAEELCRSRINELTEEFEDRLRTHWPRRGRVETQIKQPREAELLSHEEKTWRLIQDIQRHMVDIQSNFYATVAIAKKSCDVYINDVNVLKNSLSNNTFKTLAALQGVDVRARSTTIAFQQQCHTHLVHLTRITDEETASVINFAQDFRKICPPQEPGKEGGYSETEITEIQNLVDGQCSEIREKVAEWQEEIGALKEQQSQSILCQEEFNKKYEKCTQDLAMSEGLGQKYGAPRRRAQERIRTEVSRDEQSAGFVDELLAKLEYFCLEKQRLIQESGEVLNGEEDEDEDEDDHGSSAVAKKGVADGAGKGTGAQAVAVAGSAKVTGNGIKEFQLVQEIWSLIIQLRAVLSQRLEYLEIVGPRRIPVLPLTWLPSDRVRMYEAQLGGSGAGGSAAGGPATGAGEGAAAGGEEGEEAEEPENGGVPPVSPRFLRAGAMCLSAVVADVDAMCRKETRDLYISEDKAYMLQGDGPDAVPDSLSHWLHEAKEKILGRHGHRERAWKRVWSQVDRLEIILCRKPLSIVNLVANMPSASNNERISVGVPAVEMRYLSDSYISYIRVEQQTRTDVFMKSVRIWVKGRDKHERLLRPRLGSPDAVQELNALDAVELQRSHEMVEGIVRFRNNLLKKLLEISMQYIRDVTVASKALLLYIDTSLTQDMIQVPPDTAIPKVRMTLKRLRKAERLKAQIASGQEDNSKTRVWSAINMDQFQALVSSLEAIVHSGSGSGSGDDSSSTSPLPATEEFVSTIGADSAVRAMVSTAHRALVNERNRSISVVLNAVTDLSNEIAEKFSVFLKQERSWNEMWQRQVEMLRNGNI